MAFPGPDGAIFQLPEHSGRIGAAHQEGDKSQLIYRQIWKKRGLSVLNMRDGAIFLDMHVESVGSEILGYHHARVDYATRLRQILLAEVRFAVRVVGYSLAY